MSVNSSSSFNASPAPSTPSSPNDMFFELYKCFNTTVGTSCITGLTITSIFLLLPLYIFVLYLGIQRWWQQRSGMKMTHSDLLTYHMVFIELISVLGFTLSCCGVHTDHPKVTMVGIYLCSVNLTGQMYLHILTCVERYLAVVHPVTYLSLKKASMIRKRNITCGFVWLICLAGTTLMSIKNKLFVVSFAVSIMIICITVTSFCSLSVLCVLIHPGPGEGGGGSQRVDKSKLRAFYTIMIILGVLLLKFLGNTFSLAMYGSSNLGEDGMCSVWMAVFWFSLPSCLVLPLLFFQRAGKLLCCKSEDGSD